MKRFNVFVTREIPKPGLDLLSTKCDYFIGTCENRPLSRREMLDGLKKADGVLSLLTEKVTRSMMEEHPVKILANCAVGYDNIDVAAATEMGIPVTNTPGVLTETTADFAFCLLLASARRVVEGDKLTRAGKFKGWGMMMLLGNDVHGKTLGLIGMGRIGAAVARRGKGFGMRVIYADVSRNPDIERELGAQFASMDDVFRNADFISLHVPLTDRTRHLVGARELAMMKPTAHLINTSRGPVVDERALFEALRDGAIAGAGLDVYEGEPEVTPGLLSLDNVILAPHIASASVETRALMATTAAANIIAVVDGRRPPNLVNPEIYGRSAH